MDIGLWQDYVEVVAQLLEDPFTVDMTSPAYKRLLSLALLTFEIFRLKARDHLPARHPLLPFVVLNQLSAPEFAQPAATSFDWHNISDPFVYCSQHVHTFASTGVPETEGRAIVKPVPGVT